MSVNKRKSQKAKNNVQAADVQQPSRAGSGFVPLGSLFDDFAIEDKGGYITQEFQDFGYRLAAELDDLPHKSLYIKMAKEIPRGTLEEALSFVTDAPNVKSKARLFMWKLTQLKQAPQKK